MDSRRSPALLHLQGNVAETDVPRTLLTSAPGNPDKRASSGPIHSTPIRTSQQPMISGL